MRDDPLVVELDVEGPTAPPRLNGELVFRAPWESRLFGLTLALVEEGRFEWPPFQAALIAEVGRWEEAHAGGDAPYPYYELWQSALESVLASQGLLKPSAVDKRSRQLADRPHRHDHG